MIKLVTQTVNSLLVVSSATVTLHRQLVWVGRNIDKVIYIDGLFAVVTGAQMENRSKRSMKEHA